MDAIQTRRLTPNDREMARKLFMMMAEVFEEAHEPLSDGYIERILRRETFWAIAALSGDELIGGVTAHTLPMTRSESSEVFIYDLAVRAKYQRRGVGRQLITALRDAAAAQGITEVFVPADNEDVHALEFYHALGGVPAPVTIFTFSSDLE